MTQRNNAIWPHCNSRCQASICCISLSRSRNLFTEKHLSRNFPLNDSNIRIIRQEKVQYHLVSHSDHRRALQKREKIAHWLLLPIPRNYKISPILRTTPLYILRTSSKRIKYSNIMTQALMGRYLTACGGNCRVAGEFRGFAGCRWIDFSRCLEINNDQYPQKPRSCEIARRS